MNRFENHSLLIGSSDSFPNILGHDFLIVSAENLMRIDIQHLSETGLPLILGTGTSLVLVGSYFRYFLYENLFKKYKNKELRPIDTLTLFTALAQHLYFLVSVVWWTYHIVLMTEWGQYLDGSWVCTLYRFLNRFNLAYTVIGGLGLSIYRILYIQKDHWVRYVIGEKRLLNIILFGGLGIAAVTLVLFASNGFEYILNKESCRLFIHLELMQIMDAFEQSRENLPLSANWANTRVWVGFAGMCMIVTEISIYISFFHFIHKHDNSETLRRLLGQNVIQNRNKRNAVTFFGQFCSFVIEVSIMIAFTVASKWKSQYSFYMMLFFKYAGFTAMAIVEVLTSGQLRSRAFGTPKLS